MTPRPLATGMIVALLGATMLVAGCAGTTPGSGARPAGAGSAGATVSVVPSVTQTATAPTGAKPAARPSGKKDVTREDLDEIKDQLEAMQKAIDGLEMPSDNDFSGAEGAVY